MEGVEDIPGAALSAGIKWGWETFPEFLDVLDGLELAIDVGTQVPHGSVRGYVMGERGAKNEPATPDDIAAMARIVREGIEAGALGVSTSRTIAHRAIDGEPVPGTFAAEDELFAMGRALGERGRGRLRARARRGDGRGPRRVRQGDGLDAPAVRRRPGARSRSRCSSTTSTPTSGSSMLDLAMEAYEDGVPIRPQVAGRPLGLLLGLQTFHPLRDRPTLPGHRGAPARRARRATCATRRCAPRSSARRPSADPRDVVHRHGPRPHLPPRRAARLRAARRGEHRGAGDGRGSRPLRGALRPPARAGRARAPAPAAARVTRTSTRTRSAR